MTKTEILWIALAAGLVLFYWRRAGAASSPHAAGKGKEKPGYWADVL